MGQVPPSMPAPEVVIYVSGVVEILLAIAIIVLGIRHHEFSTAQEPEELARPLGKAMSHECHRTPRNKTSLMARVTLPPSRNGM